MQDYICYFDAIEYAVYHTECDAANYEVFCKEICMMKIIKNAIQCKLCGEIIESTDRHQYVTCKCGACAVDGGHDYLRRCFNDKNCYVDLSETIEISAEEEKYESGE